MAKRSMVMQMKTKKAVQFEITKQYLGVELDDALDVAENTDI